MLTPGQVQKKRERQRQTGQINRELRERFHILRNEDRYTERGLRRSHFYLYQNILETFSRTEWGSTKHMHLKLK